MTVRHKKLHPSYWYNNFAKLCHTMIIFGIYIYTREYPITCLFDSLCNIKNWDPAYQICYCLADNNVKRETVATMWDPKLHSRPMAVLTVLTLILWITGYGENCRNMFIRNLLKTERWWTEAASDWSVVWHPAMSLIRRLTSGEFALRHV